MDIAEFRESLKQEKPPEGLSAALEALWWDGKGRLGRRRMRQRSATKVQDGSWVHAYLHRKEGDLPNAKYWYRRADQRGGYGDFEREWESIVVWLLRSSSQ